MKHQPLVCLYGPARGNGSFARVTAGWRSALEHHGHLAGFCATDDREVKPCSGAYAPFAVYCGPPSRCDVMQLYGEHRARAVVLAPNSSYVPEGVVEIITQVATHCLATSWWARQVLRPYFVERDVELWRVGHGVTLAHYAGLEPVALDLDDGLKVLHFTTTAGQRKGTRELLEAWRQALPQLPARSTLTIVTDNLSQADESESVKVLPRQNLGGSDMVSFLRQHHVVCQPSRAEGFGLVPLEAAAAGVMTIVTDATGHRDYCRDDWWRGHALVGVGDDGPIDDGPGAQAPTVDPVSIRDALLDVAKTFDARQRDVAQAAAVVRAFWDWRHVLLYDGFIEKVEREFA